MALKRDSDFAAYISLGAIGSVAVAEHLRHKHGHTPIELERYSMSNKIWRTRVKRLRVPDLCAPRAGRRIESRAKQTQLGIILSDSAQSGRGWDHGGIREQDITESKRLRKSLYRQNGHDSNAESRLRHGSNIRI